MRHFLLLFLSAVLLAGCQQNESRQQQMTASPAAKRFPLRGKVLSVNKSKMEAAIAHEEIPGFMDAMTMDFPVKNEDALGEMVPGSDVSAELVVEQAKGTYWLENIALTPPAGPSGAAAPPVPLKEGVVQIGKEPPDFLLTNQDGRRISLKDFRGRALAVTFIYSRCPLPNVCILMSKNFSDLANRLRNDPVRKDRIRLLSVSFDPEHDTPETLKKYGQGYLGKDAPADFTVWQLASGTDREIKEIADFFGLLYEKDGGGGGDEKPQFNHTLRTVVIAPDGTVRKIFTGSDWTTDELLRELEGSLK